MLPDACQSAGLTCPHVPLHLNRDQVYDRLSYHNRKKFSPYCDSCHCAACYHDLAGLGRKQATLPSGNDAPLDQQTDGRPLIRPNSDVEKGRHACNIKPFIPEIAARNNDGLDRLIGRPRADRLHIDRFLGAYHTCDSPGDGTGARMGGNLQAFLVGLALMDWIRASGREVSRVHIPCRCLRMLQ